MGRLKIMAKIIGGKGISSGAPEVRKAGKTLKAGRTQLFGLGLGKLPLTRKKTTRGGKVLRTSLEDYSTTDWSNTKLPDCCPSPRPLLWS
jgi:hypothetical protein